MTDGLTANLEQLCIFSDQILQALMADDVDILEEVTESREALIQQMRRLNFEIKALTDEQRALLDRYKGLEKLIEKEMPLSRSRVLEQLAEVRKDLANAKQYDQKAGRYVKAYGDYSGNRFDKLK